MEDGPGARPSHSPPARGSLKPWEAGSALPTSSPTSGRTSSRSVTGSASHGRGPSSVTTRGRCTTASWTGPEGCCARRSRSVGVVAPCTARRSPRLAPYGSSTRNDRSMERGRSCSPRGRRRGVLSPSLRISPAPRSYPMGRYCPGDCLPSRMCSLATSGLCTPSDPTPPHRPRRSGPPISRQALPPTGAASAFGGTSRSMPLVSRGIGMPGLVKGHRLNRSR